MSCARFSACEEDDTAEVEDAAEEEDVGVGVDPEDEGIEEGSVEGARPREARFPMTLSVLPLLEGARTRASVPPAAPSVNS